MGLLEIIGGTLGGRLIEDRIFPPAAPRKPPGGKALTFRNKGTGAGTVGEINPIPGSATNNGFAHVLIAEGDLNRYSPFNGIFVQNDSDENFLVVMDGEESTLLVPAKSSQSAINLNYRDVFIQNLSASTPSNNEVLIMAQNLVERA